MLWVEGDGGAGKDERHVKLIMLGLVRLLQGKEDQEGLLGAVHNRVHMWSCRCLFLHHIDGEPRSVEEWQLAHKLGR